MGLLSKMSLVGAGRRVAKNNAPAVHRGIDTVTSAVKGRLPARHHGKVDTGASLTKRALTGRSAKDVAEESRQAR
jgi:hypothetical protein